MAKRPQTRRPRRRGPKRAGGRFKSKAFTKAVQKIIHKNVESKQAFHSLATTSYNSGINATGDAPRVVPTILQGTAEDNRIGEQITAQSLKVKGAIVYNPSTGQYGTYANSRIAVRLMIVQPRQYSNLDDVQANIATWCNTLLKKGSNSVAFTGILSDLWAPINSDAIIKYYDRLFYMSAPYQQTAVGSTLMGNSTKFFNISLKLRNKILKYNSLVASGQQPTNYAPVVLLGYAHLDGSSPDTLSTAVQMTYDTMLTFEDA